MLTVSSLSLIFVSLYTYATFYHADIQRETIRANAVLHQHHPYPCGSPYQSLIDRHNMHNIPRHENTNEYIGYPALSPSASASTSAASSIFSAPHRQEDHVPVSHTQAVQHHRQHVYQHQMMMNHPTTKQIYQYTEAEQKFQFHYNLLIFMRHPQQHAKISYDASISAVLILIWCAFNMIFGFSANPSLQLIPSSIGEANPLSIAAQTLNIEKMYQRQEIFHNLVVFGIAVLNIHKDIILCNAQLCLPMLLLFNFTGTVRFARFTFS